MDNGTSPWKGVGLAALGIGVVAGGVVLWRHIVSGNPDASGAVPGGGPGGGGGGRPGGSGGGRGGGGGGGRPGGPGGGGGRPGGPGGGSWGPGLSGHWGRSRRPIHLRRPGGFYSVPYWQPFQVVDDYGPIYPMGWLLQLLLEDGNKGWAVMDPYDLSGCLSEGTCRLGEDLPVDFKDAKPVVVAQSKCLTDMTQPEAVRPTIDLSQAPGGVQITVHNYRGRCEQALGAFALVRGSEVKILIQPRIMEPESVTRCTCSYDLVVYLPLGAGTHNVSTWSRGDRYGRTDDPPVVRVGLGTIRVMA